jgi:hypothetical protein
LTPSSVHLLAAAAAIHNILSIMKVLFFTDERKVLKKPNPNSHHAITP